MPSPMQRISDFLKASSEPAIKQKLFPLESFYSAFLNIWAGRGGVVQPLLGPLQNSFFGLEKCLCLCLIRNADHHSRTFFLGLPLTVWVNYFPTLNFSSENGTSQTRLAIIDESQ